MPCLTCMLQIKIPQLKSKTETIFLVLLISLNVLKKNSLSLLHKITGKDRKS